MNSINKEIFINAAPEIVWRHLEDPDLLAGWLMRNSFDAERGAKFQLWGRSAGNWDGTIFSELANKWGQSPFWLKKSELFVVDAHE